MHEIRDRVAGVEGARKVVDLWCERTEALGARDDVAYVLVFENRGEEVGATIAHPHGQIYAYDGVPDVPLTELRRAARGACAGTGCTAGKLGGPEAWTKTGLGAATVMAGDAVLTAIAVVNPFGDVIARDGSILAGIRSGSGWRPTLDAMRNASAPWRVGEATTLVCLVTDAKLTKTEAWQVSRAATAGMARALSPVSTAVDGDLVTCLSSGAVPVDPFLFSALAAEVTAEAIRDGARQASAAAPNLRS